MNGHDRYKYLRVNPTREFAKVLTIVAVASVALIYGLGFLSEGLASKVPVEVEAKLFQKSDGSFWAPGDRKDDPFLSGILEKLKAGGEASPYSFSIQLLCSETPNAYALPGGKIIVTSGLLDYVETENGLAFVVGHELGHFKHRHHLRGFGKGIVFATVLSSLGLSGADKMIGGVSDFVELGHSRDQERAADDYGIVLMKHSYGSLKGAEEFFANIAKKEGDPAAFLSTHPSSEERVIRIRALSSELGQSSGKIPTELKERCKKPSISTAKPTK